MKEIKHAIVYTVSSFSENIEFHWSELIPNKWSNISSPFCLGNVFDARLCLDEGHEWADYDNDRDCRQLSNEVV